MIAMANTNEVIKTLNDALTTVEAETSDLAGGVLAVVGEEDIGRTFGLLRREGYDFSAKRLDDTLVVRIEAEEKRGLGDLFR